MRQQHTSYPIVLRFKRWSRKAYAAFISIRQAVTIGQLAANVSERFQTKQGSTHRTTLFINQGMLEEEGYTDSGLLNESLPFSASLWQLLTALPMQSIKQPAAPSIHYIYISERADIFSVILKTSALSVLQPFNLKEINQKYD